MQSEMIELQRQSRSFGNRDEWEETIELTPPLSV
jgi:hypothetical protein